jgi:hypothetical protein
VVARYGWFDRSADDGGEDTVWIAGVPAAQEPAGST